MSVLRGGASYASQGRISVTGHRAEPNEHGRSMCRGRYSTCSGYNCRWWAAVALGGPVSINQPALNTRPSAGAGAGAGRGSHDSPADRNCPECGSRAHDLCLAANCRPAAFRRLAARQNVVFQPAGLLSGPRALVSVRHMRRAESMSSRRVTDETSFFRERRRGRIVPPFVYSFSFFFFFYYFCFFCCCCSVCAR